MPPGPIEQYADDLTGVVNAHSVSSSIDRGNAAGGIPKKAMVMAKNRIAKGAHDLPGIVNAGNANEGAPWANDGEAHEIKGLAKSRSESAPSRIDRGNAAGRIPKKAMAPGRI